MNNKHHKHLKTVFLRLLMLTGLNSRAAYFFGDTSLRLLSTVSLFLVTCI